MTRQYTAAGLCAIALAVLVTGSLHLPVRAAAAVPAASGGCTAWRSTDTPPPTIRVLRTLGPLAGTVQEVDFRTYVATTFAAEWPSHYEVEALKAGAIAVKQYGWYYTTVYRGRTSANGDCYDVEDDTTDQYFQPEIKSPHARHLRAIAATWHLTLRKWRPKRGSSRFFATGYRSGTTGRCGAEADQWHLFQRGVNGCALAGMTMEQTLRVYLDPKLEIVDRGAHDILGLASGDAAHLAFRADAGRVPAVHPALTAGFARPVVSSFGLDAATTLGVASADVSGDGREDLIVFSRIGDQAQRLSVAVPDGTGYGRPSTWWEGETGRPSARVRLLVEDFDGDGRPDAGVLGQGATAGSASLVVSRSTGRDFRDPLP